MSSTNEKTKRATLSFASIDSYVERNIVSPKEKNISSKNMVEWGDGNAYPDYLLDLYNNAPTLSSIINGTIDYIVGDDISIIPIDGQRVGYVNPKESIREQVRNLAKDYEVYGGFALQVIRDFTGKVSTVYYIDLRYLRMDKEGQVFYYCEEWHKRGKKDTLVYPAFMPNLDWGSLNEEERERHSSSILYVKKVNSQVYPSPIYSASVKSCEIERLIDDYHINAINNQFTSSAIINFNNGIPDDETKKAIEKDFNEKFGGSENAGRIMFSWNENKESATEIVEFKVEDFGERYDALSKHSRQSIFTAFRAIPILFGLTSEANTGFSTDEFEQSFKLYNRTQVRPVQRMISEAYEKIFGVEGALTIVPFSLEGSTEKTVE